MFLLFEAPSNAENLTVIVKSSTEIYVTWNPQTDIKEILSSYIIEWINEDGGINKAHTNETYLAINGLQPFTNYTVKVGHILKIRNNFFMFQNNEPLNPLCCLIFIKC